MYGATRMTRHEAGKSVDWNRRAIMLYHALNDLTDRKRQQFQMFLQSHTSILCVLTLVHK